MKFLLFSIFFALLCSILRARMPFRCPKIPTSPTNLYRHPIFSHCEEFYQCSNGVANLMHCPWPLVFHEDIGGCANRIEGDCLAPDPICPTDTIQASSADCSKFFLCSYGVSTLMECAEGTVFNPVIGSCDWPANVDCSNTRCYNNPTGDYTNFAVASRTICQPEEYYTAKSYKYDVTGKTFVFCLGYTQILVYCCGDSHFDINEKKCVL